MIISSRDANPTQPAASAITQNNQQDNDYGYGYDYDHDHPIPASNIHPLNPLNHPSSIRPYPQHPSPSHPQPQPQPHHHRLPSNRSSPSSSPSSSAKLTRSQQQQQHHHPSALVRLTDSVSRLFINHHHHHPPIQAQSGTNPAHPYPPTSLQSESSLPPPSDHQNNINNHNHQLPSSSNISPQRSPTINSSSINHHPSIRPMQCIIRPSTPNHSNLSNSFTRSNLSSPSTPTAFYTPISHNPSPFLLEQNYSSASPIKASHLSHYHHLLNSHPPTTLSNQSHSYQTFNINSSHNIPTQDHSSSLASPSTVEPAHPTPSSSEPSILTHPITTPTHSMISPIDIKHQHCLSIDSKRSNKLKNSHRNSTLGTYPSCRESLQQKKFHRYSGSVISPKDAITLDCSPPIHPKFSNSFNSPRFQTREPPSNPTSPVDELRIAPNPSPLVPVHSPSYKRTTWSSSSQSTSRKSWILNQHQHQPTPNLTQGDIKEIERLGVKFIDPPIPTSHRSSSSSIQSPAATGLLERSISLGSTLNHPPVRRSSLIHSKRRKSIKLHPTTHAPTPLNQFKVTNDLSKLPSTDEDAIGRLKPLGISADQLLEMSTKSANHKGKENEPPLLVIDLRCLSSYLGPNGRLKGSINVNFPSLLIKRFRKGTPGNFQLYPFITTEAGKRYYSKLEKSYQCPSTPTGSSSSSSSILQRLDVCVIDDDLDDELEAIVTSNKPNYHSTHRSSFGKLLLDVLSKLFHQGGRTTGLYFLSERFEELAKKPAAQSWLLLGEQDRPDDHPHDRPLDQNLGLPDRTSIDPRKMNLNLPSQLNPGPQGLLRLRPSPPTRSLPSIDPDSISSITSLTGSLNDLKDIGCSSPPVANLLASPQSKIKPPKLRRIDTSESLIRSARQAQKPSHPKLPLSPLKTDDLTLNYHSKSLSSQTANRQMSHLFLNTNNCSHSATIEPLSFKLLNNKSSSRPSASKVSSINPQDGGLAGGIGSVRNSYDGSGGRSPSPTAQHHPEICFKVSTIIPSFLYLGPEPSKHSDFEELHQLGIKRILNMALECTEEEQLIQKHHQFIDKYFQIPLRDFVEESGVQRAIDEANKILNDAFLHSAPTYVHCKAGKSRSVTIVLAYLIHRYRWSLRQSYAHVSERRTGICPNIGFLAELMNFEEREIGSKSHGVVGSSFQPPKFLGHKPNTRSLSHHYSASGCLPNSQPGGVGGMGQMTTVGKDQCTDPNSNSIESSNDSVIQRPSFLHHHHRFNSYSMIDKSSSSSRHDHHHSNSINLKDSNQVTRHRNLRVQSVALSSKSDFFSNSSSTTKSSTSKSTTNDPKLAQTSDSNSSNLDR